ncbi:MAG: phosphoglycerate dehydrogenase [Candidatus Eremiobacteraeota bacterium]|nr:phosphoglycerate dehydrogenase [Candidatus Eremiobacteraeota bacterium]
MAHDRGPAQALTMLVVTVDFMWHDALAALLAPSCTVRAAPKAAAERDAALANAEVLVSAVFTHAMAAVCKQLRLLVCPPAGTERIDRAALPNGVRLENGTGHEIPMAEYVMGCCVALRQHLLQGDAALRRGRWTYGFQGGDGMQSELYGSRLGLIGFGGIAHEIIVRATAFGMTCSAVTMHPAAHATRAGEVAFLGSLERADDIDRVVGSADQLVICCELSATTKGLMDARRLRLMKPNAVLINVARGGIVVEADLFDALKERRIAGAALDVWYRYPQEPKDECLPAGVPFWELDNVIMTPHASGWTEAAKKRRLEAMARAINEFAHAEAL